MESETAATLDHEEVHNHHCLRSARGHHGGGSGLASQRTPALHPLSTCSRHHEALGPPAPRSAGPGQARPVFFTERRIRPNNDAVGARERIWELAGCLGRVSQLPHPGGVIRPLIPLAEQEMPRPLLELYFVAAAFICRSASYAVFACLATYARISSASAADTYFPNRGMPSGARSPSTTTRRKATAS